MSPVPRWRENTTGKCPPALSGKGKRCWVELRNGIKPAAPWVAPTARWSLDDDPFDIVRYLPETGP